MRGAAAHEPSFWTVESFRAFYETRPDEERWELIDGVAIMMMTPTIAHQRLASNLQWLLNEASRTHDPTRFAFQRIGVDLLPEVQAHHPEPDVAVMDAAIEPGQRYTERFYLTGEIMSESDHKRLPQRSRTRVEAKREVYRRQPDSSCIVLISQDEILVQLDLRLAAGWRTLTLRESDEPFLLADFGLSCTVRDLYAGTPLLT